MKNKTIAAWLAFLGGIVGLHRFYLHGLRDVWGYLMMIPTALGYYGLQRVQRLGQDDQIAWVLIPLLGFSFAACALTAIVYALMSAERWNAAFNAGQRSDEAAGQSNWLTVACAALALMFGATALMASIAFSFQRYFEYQIEAARQISQ